MKIVITSGYFNPLHPGHIEMLTMARKLGDKLIVIVNNDYQVKIKGSRRFMDENDRMAIIKALKPVDEVILSVDSDRGVCNTIRLVNAEIKGRWPDEIIFAKGGDRFISNVPEVEVCAELGIKIIDGLGPKIRASSEILAAI